MEIEKDIYHVRKCINKNVEVGWRFKVLVISDNKCIFEVTHSIIGRIYDIRWCNYDKLKKMSCFSEDIIIMHFNKNILRAGIFEQIMKVKGKAGYTVPILAVVEDATPQDIFTILEAGVYDYIEDIEKTQQYKEKIENTILWHWYLKKYGISRNEQ